MDNTGNLTGIVMIPKQINNRIHESLKNSL